jgi:hypothetical protein
MDCDDCSSSTNTTREAREQPRPPADLLKEPHDRIGGQPNNGISCDVRHKSEDAILPLNRPFEGDHHAQHHSMHYSRNQE